MWESLCQRHYGNNHDSCVRLRQVLERLSEDEENSPSEETPVIQLAVATHSRRASFANLKPVLNPAFIYTTTIIPEKREETE